jgi:uncharacterized protein YhaN
LRFIGLDLERYGPFTDRRIRFREGARLHLVFGRNEAGKSTALAAVTDLLFGFPQRATQDFLHRMRDLRVGASIVDRSGKVLDFRRRRGNLRTLIDAGEAALPEDALQPYLGQMTREVFTRAFGLSTQELREGGKDMLKEKGDIGSALFAAASGLHGPSQLKRSLDAQAERIFDVKRAAHRTFYQAQDRYNAARKAEGEHRLRAGDWKELNESIAALAQKQSEIDAERSRLSGEGARLSRLKRLAPLVLLLDASVGELDRLDVATVAEAYAGRLKAALESEARAVQQRRDCAKALEELELELAGLSVDEALLAHKNDVDALLADSGLYAKTKLDLPGVDRETQGLRRDVEELAKRLGLTHSAELESRLPADADLALLGGLSLEGRALEAETHGLRATLTRERLACASLEREQAGRGPAPIDPEPLRERLAEVEPVLRRLEQQGELQRAIQAEERAIAEAASRLDPQVLSLDALARAPLPASETMARFRKEFDAAGRSLERAREEAQSAERSCLEIEAALEKLAAGRAVPTADVIAAERSARDCVWGPLRAALFGAELSAPARSSSVASFERHVAEADRLADEALADARRVAQHGVHVKNLQAERERQAKAQRALAESELREGKLAEDWRAAWAAAKLSPLPPAEMAAWSSALAALLDRRSRLEEQRQRLLGLAAQEGSIIEALRAAARAAGLDAAEGVPALRIAARLEAGIRRLSEAWETARGVAAKVAAARERVEQYEAMLEDASMRSLEWKERWRAALPRLGLPPEYAPDQAEAVSKAWGEVPEAMRLLAKEERRIAGMRRDNAAFEERAAALFAALAPELVGAPVQMAAHTLSERASAAARAAARREDCGKRLAVAADRDKIAEAALGEARSSLLALAAEIGAGQDDDLHAVLERLERRSALESALGARREELLRAADGLDEEAIRAELSGFDLSLADQRLLELGEEDKRLVVQSQEVYASRKDASKRKDELEAGSGAELAVQMRRNAESELAREARQWAVLRLGALLIGAAIERHREAAQNPLMSRAAALFSSLTAGAFIGLGSQADEDDVPVLVGQRADGTQVSIEGLSEGTRDQLYLALRLAYVETFAASQEPPPFIADDIFVTFDDERTGHGVAALAEIGAKVQCILFTHHRRTVEIAAERLGDAVDIIEL